MVFQDMRQMPIFSAFTDDQLRDLRIQGVEMHLDAGQVLFQEGDPAQGLYVILEGELEIIKRIGAQTLVVARVPSGSFVGEISMLTGLPHTATVRTTMPSHF